MGEGVGGWAAVQERLVAVRHRMPKTIRGAHARSMVLAVGGDLGATKHDTVIMNM